ncbi:hypothetical protein [Allokutzneria multivorans]
MSATLILVAHGLVVISLVMWLVIVIRRELRAPSEPSEHTAVLPKITVTELRERQHAEEMRPHSKSSAEPRRAVPRPGSAASKRGGVA